jgi:hypothetical protein
MTFVKKNLERWLKVGAGMGVARYENSIVGLR